MPFRIAIILLILLVFPAYDGVASMDEETDLWSKCDCPANDPNYNAAQAQDRPPSARMAYLISVHNRRTIQDGAYLIKALMETYYPGDTAVILIHVDKRAGIASRDLAEEKKDEKNQFLYDDSSLRKYVDACLAAPACTGNGRNAMNHKTSNNATILEVHSHFSPAWSKWSMNDPTLWAMNYLTNHPKLNGQHGSQSWDVFVNLSGDTLPVITAERISQLFEPQNGPLGNTNFVTSASCVTGLLPTSIYDFPKHSMKRGHYFQKNIPTTLSYVDSATGKWREDVNTPIYFGSQWMALTHDFVEYVIRSMDHPNGLGNVLKETLIETGVLMTDETFFATMLMNSPAFKDTIPQLNEDGALESYPSMHSLRYERMDENAPNAWGKYTSSDPLYDIPTKFGKATDGEGPAKAWGPYFLGTYDLGSIRDSGALFVRKVSWTVDPNLVRMLPVKSSSGREEGKLEWDELPDIRWPALGVNVKDPFVWAYTMAMEEDGEED
mmetsp:Transcript_1095/g.2287  ORF Transcript_1095/g.2287 Transcript_1095/m.2287 type:complete len:495 (+) Transcript_1095:83-1567(+)|eukprot:CAMPEP_0172317532 /NCGR_PEP_ID=MMETSP1058-20130122/31911_1 /TAXON_ID=83371 /ORGANISM="Detonula confervacea, Strain CCMP 353" /LENGTH=494 /DNA_ID=CAMNT_0013032117 /DNA_START=57 /DNA_END=1541 /DNA_ORIENTATION=+